MVCKEIYFRQKKADHSIPSGEEVLPLGQSGTKTQATNKMNKKQSQMGFVMNNAPGS